MNLNKQKIVITGGAGFIGSAIAHHLDKTYPDCEVLVVDTFRNEETFSNGNLKSFGHFKNLLGFSGEIYEGDITKKQTLKVIKRFKPDIIFHEAAISDTTVMDQGIMVDTNVNAYKNLLELCLDKNIKMIYASSGATYGDAKSPQKVWECEKPKNIYGFSKLAMDYLSLKYIKKGLHVVGLRYFNVYGKGEFFKNTTASMVLQFAHQILRGNAPRLFERSDKILRDFIYIEDVVSANIKAIEAKKCGIYNIGTAKPRSFQDIADILQHELKTNYGNEYIKNPYSAYQFHTEADIKPTEKYLGYKPKYSLEEGIKDYLPEIKRLFKEEVNV